ncbi:MAG: acyl-ACP thioesterase [Clostridiaceae bacterium]|nr:acyl-ACP thioesterase [Clostridiaceae bacterium]
MNRLITSKEYEIHFYEIDYNRKALITSIVNFLGDISIRQSDELGVGLDWLLERDLAWVIYKWNINMIRYPKINEKITVRTWPYSMRKFYAYRQYDILDTEGKVICTADAIWFLIDIKIRKPTKISDEMYETYGIAKDSNEVIDFGKIEALQEIHESKYFDVRYSDIDTNRHVNNSKYIEWCIETVPIDVVLKYSLKNIKVIYEKETNYGERIKTSTEVFREVGKVTFLHKIEDEYGKRITLVKSQWE